MNRRRQRLSHRTVGNTLHRNTAREIMRVVTRYAPGPGEDFLCSTAHATTAVPLDTTDRVVRVLKRVRLVEHC